MKYIAVGAKINDNNSWCYKFIGEARDYFEDAYHDYMEKARDYPIAHIEICTDSGRRISTADIIPERRL